MDAWLQVLRRWMFGGPRPMQRRLTTLTMLAIAGTLASTCLVGWVALRATLVDNNQRGSLLIARDLNQAAVEDLTTTGRLTARVLGPGTTVVEAVSSTGRVLSAPGEDVSLIVGAAEVGAAARQETTARGTTSSTEENYRIVTLPLGTLTASGQPGSVGPAQAEGWVLVVGRPMTASEQILQVFGLVVLGMGVLGWAGPG